MILVLYGSRAVDTVRSWGYEVVEYPELPGHQTSSAPSQGGFHELGQKAVGVAAGFVQTGLNMALDWLGDPSNQEEIIRLGVKIARAVLSEQERSES